MAAASLFSEMKSVNPAVIGGRQTGQYSLVLHSDKYEKDQEISESETAKMESSISGFSGFIGGKSGSFITTELVVILQTGDREMLFRGGADDFDITADVSYNQIELGIGISKYFGVTLSRQGFKLDQKFKATDINSDESISRSSLGLKLGSVLPLGPLRFSAYYEMISATQDVVSERPALPESSTKPKNTFIGLGFGIVTKGFHAELALERFLDPEKGLLEPEEDPDPDAKNRISATIEFTMGSLALGYTGRLYQDGYKNQDQTIMNQLIYANSSEDRLEHNINFSLGADKGFSFGGSVTYSKTEGDEKNPIEPSAIKTKYPTKSTQLGAMAKIGYVW